MHEGTVDTPLDTPPWLTLAEAARALGISEKTARRRAKAGVLEARQIPTQHGPAWQVRLPNGVPTAGRVDSTVLGMGTHVSTVAPGSDLDGLVALVDRLQVENRQLAEAAAVWQTRAMLLEERLALTAPQRPVEAPTAPEPPTPATDAPGPWYRRWRTWLAAGLVVAVAGSVSCSASGTVKHAELCAASRKTIDYWTSAMATAPFLPDAALEPLHTSVAIAEKVC